MAAIQQRVLAAFNAKAATHPNLAAFEHDVSVFMQDVGKLKSKRLANSAFKLWSKHESKVSSTVLSQRVVQCGDILLQAQEYGLARDLCYGWLLMKWRILADGACQREAALATLLSVHEEETQKTLLLAGVGHSLAGYHLLAKGPAHENVAASALHSLELLAVVMQVALHREGLHWILHNGIALVYALSTLLMDRGHYSEVVQYLLWGVVAMETSVPLMTSVHLPLRTRLYCAVCKCHFVLRRPDLAEVLARRALGKVSELIQLQNLSSTPQSKETERAYKEAAIKLGLMVFRRSVFESRKKTRSILRTKARPPLRDILQTPWPRSATEKFVTDMFQGKSARFQAILTALEDPTCLPLEQAGPQPIKSELDMETFQEVHQELVTAGVDLAMKCMSVSTMDGGGGGGGGGGADDGKESEASIGPQLSLEGSLMDLSLEGQDVIPVSSVAHFARVLFSFGYNEAFHLIADQLISIIKDCDAVALRCHLAVLRVIQSVVSLRQLKQELALTSQGDGSTALLDGLLALARLLVTASELPILESEGNLLSTATLFLWDHSRRGYFTAITSHQRKGCEKVFNSPLRKKLLTLLSLTQTLFAALSLWDSQVTAAGEVCLKLAYLLEYSAEDAKPNLEGMDLSGVEPALLKALHFDRSSLLEALSVADSGLKGVQQARTALRGRHQHTSASVEGLTASEGVELLHVELLCCRNRLHVKLASTLPPPPPTAKQPKLSSLKNKVEEQKALLEKREKLLSLITAASAEIRSWDELITSCGRNHFLSAMYLMQQALLAKELGSDTSELSGLLSQALNHLKAYVKPSLEGASNEVGVLEGVCPPPPTLAWLSDDRMVFTPPDHFVPASGEKVCWYTLFGRSASGSNVKVRLNDTHLTGLGVPVPAGRDCKLIVEGLKANEMYVFAVAAYTQDGRLVGDSVGTTSQPFLAAFPMPRLAGLAYLCKCSFEAGVLAVAESAGQILWHHFTEEKEGGEGEREGLKSIHYGVQLRQEVLAQTSPQLVSLFATCAFILVQVEVVREGPVYTRLDWTRPPFEQQLLRLAVCERLLLAIELSSGLEEAGLCLQAVVMCYGVLAPLIQNQLMAPPLAKIVLKCLCVLKELPKAVLLQHPLDQKQHIHHMVAVLAAQGLKMLHVCNSRGLLGHLAGAVKDLLTTTLVTTELKPLPLEETAVSKAWSKSAQLGGHSLSESMRLPQTTVRMKTAELKRGKDKKLNLRRKSKKMAATASALAEEHKSGEMKALEACLTMWKVDSQEVELTGQEDINLLYGTLATESAVNAQKDVHKFRRRPRYLEFFVHLCCKAMEEGQYSSVVTWSEEALSWLRRRNELLVQPRVPTLTRKEPSTLTGDQARYTTAVSKYTEKPKSHIMRHHSQLAVKPPQDSLHPPHTPHNPAQPKDTQALVPAGDVGRHIKRESSKSVLPAGLVAVVTRDDLIGKAKSVLQSLLSEHYHQIARRRRLRAVTAEELPWRAELHLLLAQSCLEQLTSHLRPMQRASDGEAPDKLHSFPQSLLLLDNAGVLMKDVLVWGLQWQQRKETCLVLHRYVSSLKPKQPEDSGQDRDGEVYSPHTVQYLVEAVDTAGGGGSGGQTSASRTSPGGGRAEKEKAKNYVLPPELEGMAEIATEFQKAVVLSHRGCLWTLLQNTCHEMYTSVSHIAQLLGAIPGQSGATGDSPVSRGRELQAVLYSCMARALCAGSVALMDMALQLEGSGMELRKELPDVFTSETEAKRFLSPHPVDLSFLVRFVLLSFHALHSSQLWERLVDLISTFNQLTSYKYAEVTVPLLKQSQEELLLRLSAHRYTHREQGIHPAAHLDPGPTGHDVYGRHGHALGLTAVSLDPKEAEEELARKRAAPVSSQDLLRRSRTLLARGLMTLGEGDAHQIGSLVSESVVGAYKSAVEELKRDKETLLAATALLELGTVQFHQQDSRSASASWTEGLAILLQSSDVLNSWRVSLKSPRAALKTLGYQGLWTAFILSARLAKYTYVNELDVRLEYMLLAVALTKCLQSDSMSGAVDPDRDLDYLHLQDSCPTLPRGGALCGTAPSSVLDALAFVSEELVDHAYSDKVLPVLCLYHTFASSVCRSVEHVARSKLLRVEAMTQLHLVSEAVLALKGLLNGSGLPQEHNHFARPPQSHGGRTTFNSSLPLSDPQNFKVLAYLLDKQLPPSLASLFGPVVVSRLALARARLCTALARTIPGTPSVSVVSRQGTAEVSRPATALSTLSSYLPGNTESEGATSPTGSVASSGSKAHTAHSSHPTATAAAKEVRVPPPTEIKSSLLQHAEDNILFVYRQQEEDSQRGSLSLVIKCYLALAEVCLAQHMPSLAANCALAAMRVVQSHFERGERNTPTGEVVGTWMWLACREALAGSLAHLHSHCPRLSSPLSLERVCEEGQREASACGALGTVARLHWYRAVHCLARKKADVDCAVSNLEECLKVLDSCQSLSPALRLLKMRVSFHLAVLVSLSSGARTPEEGIMDVVAALARDLSNEIAAVEALPHGRQGQPGNAYLPHRVLLAQCELFLGHYRCSSLHLSQGLRECRGTAQGSLLLEVQLLYNLGAASKAHSVDDAKLVDAVGHLRASLWLAEAASLCSQSNSLHRLCELCFVETADLFIERCEAAPLTTSAATPEHSQKGSQLSKGQTLSQLDQRSTPIHTDRSSSSASPAGDRHVGLRKQQKDRYVDTVVAWCSLRAALHAQQACQRLDATALEMGRQDLSKALNDKAISSLPDAFLLELVHGDHSYPATSNATPLSLYALSPSSQTLKAVSITWRQVFTLLNEMRQRMAPSNLSPVLSHYSTPLAYHTEAECQSLHKALLEHCASVYEACLTPLLPRLITEHLTKMCTKHRVDLPVVPLPTPSQLQVERWFGAGESQVVQHCYTPVVCSGREEEEEGTVMLVAFNAKLIKHLSSFTMASTSGINVLKVSGSRERLSRLRESLDACASKLKGAVMVNEAAEKGSKTRRASTAVKTVIPPDLQPVLSKTLEEVYVLCNRQPSEGPSPHLSMQTLLDLADIFDPSSAPALKGSGELCSLLTVIAKEKRT